MQNNDSTTGTPIGVPVLAFSLPLVRITLVSGLIELIHLAQVAFGQIIAQITIGEFIFFQKAFPYNDPLPLKIRALIRERGTIKCIISNEHMLHQEPKP